MPFWSFCNKYVSRCCFPSFAKHLLLSHKHSQDNIQRTYEKDTTPVAMKIINPRKDIGQAEDSKSPQPPRVRPFSNPLFFQAPYVIDYANVLLVALFHIYVIFRIFRWLTLYHTFITFNDQGKEDFWKHCGKWRKMLVTSIFSFSHNVFYPIAGNQRHFITSKELQVPSIKSKIFRLLKEINLFQQTRFYNSPNSKHVFLGFFFWRKMRKWWLPVFSPFSTMFLNPLVLFGVEIKLKWIK